MDEIDTEIKEEEMDEFYDIYGDLSTGPDLGEQVEKLQEQIKLLEQRSQSLEDDIQKLSIKLNEMKRERDNLAKNISELYKTAKAELDRKDRIINELRTQLDQQMLQKRVGYLGTKRPRENSVSSTETESQHKRARRDHYGHSIRSKHSPSYKKSRSRSKSRDRYKHKSSRSRSKSRDRNKYTSRSRDENRKEHRSNISDKHAPKRDKKLDSNRESYHKNKMSIAEKHKINKNEAEKNTISKEEGKDKKAEISKGGESIKTQEKHVHSEGTKNKEIHTTGVTEKNITNIAKVVKRNTLENKTCSVETSNEKLMKKDSIQNSEGNKVKESNILLPYNKEISRSESVKDKEKVTCEEMKIETKNTINQISDNLFSLSENRITPKQEDKTKSEHLHTQQISNDEEIECIKVQICYPEPPFHEENEECVQNRDAIEFRNKISICSPLYKSGVNKLEEKSTFENKNTITPGKNHNEMKSKTGRIDVVTSKLQKRLAVDTKDADDELDPNVMNLVKKATFGEEEEYSSDSEKSVKKTKGEEYPENKNNATVMKGEKHADGRGNEAEKLNVNRDSENEKITITGRKDSVGDSENRHQKVSAKRDTENKNNPMAEEKKSAADNANIPKKVDENKDKAPFSNSENIICEKLNMQKNFENNTNTSFAEEEKSVDTEKESKKENVKRDSENKNERLTKVKEAVDDREKRNKKLNVEKENEFDDNSEKLPMKLNVEKDNENKKNENFSKEKKVVNNENRSKKVNVKKNTEDKNNARFAEEKESTDNNETRNKKLQVKKNTEVENDAEHKKITNSSENVSLKLNVKKDNEIKKSVFADKKEIVNNENRPKKVNIKQDNESKKSTFAGGKEIVNNENRLKKINVKKDNENKSNPRLVEEKKSSNDIESKNKKVNVKKDTEDKNNAQEKQFAANSGAVFVKLYVTKDNENKKSITLTEEKKIVDNKNNPKNENVKKDVENKSDPRLAEDKESVDEKRNKKLNAKKDSENKTKEPNRQTFVEIEKNEEVHAEPTKSNENPAKDIATLEKENYVKESICTPKSDKKIPKLITDQKPRKSKDGLPKKENKEKTTPNNKKEKQEEEPPPESDRVLRSAVRRNSGREKNERFTELFVETPKEDQLEETISKETETTKPGTTPLPTVNISTVNLTHEGDIPVLHIAETDRPPANFFNLTSTGMTSSPLHQTVDMDILKEDLNISLDQSINNSSKTDSISHNSPLSQNNSKNDSELSRRTVLNTSSARKRRRIVITMIDA